jgi:hypothetical protein
VNFKEGEGVIGRWSYDWGRERRGKGTRDEISHVLIFDFSIVFTW